MTSLDDEGLWVVRFPMDHPTDARNEFMRGALARIGGEIVHNSSVSFDLGAPEQGPYADRVVWRGQAERDAKPIRLLAVAIVCGPDQYLGMYHGSAALPEARGLVPLLGAHCTDTPKRPPPMAEVAAAACARGDRRGCPRK